MSDIKEKRKLELNDPNKTFEELIEHKITKYGMTRDESISDILEAATLTIKSVNKELGLG